MSLDQTKDNIRKLTDSEFDHLRIWIYDAEQPRRRQEKAKLEAQTQLVAEMVEAGSISPAKSTVYADALAGEQLHEWVDPAGDMTKMHFPDATLRKGERAYRNTLNVLNGADPETGHGWEDVTEIIEDATAPSDPDTRPNGSADQPWPWHVGRTVSKGHHVEHEGVVYKAAESYLIQEGDNPATMENTFTKTQQSGNLSTSGQ